MKTTSIFTKNIEAYKGASTLTINQGGTSSSKTYSILQLIFLIAFLQKKARIISVVSFALPHLKLGAIRDFNSILISNGIIPDDVCKKTDMEYTIGNSIIEFFGTENLGKVHGPRRDILFINEANNIKYDIYTQLAIRTRECIFLDYNPVQSFWVHDELIPNFKHTFIKSTYKDNEYLDSNTVKQIELRKGNANWWRVYGEGEIGILEGAIYTNWHYGEFDTSLSYGFGLDFGFFPDPDALIKVAIDKKNKKIYAKECFYENNQLIDNLKSNVSGYVKGSELIIADSASPRMIAELKSKFNVRPVIKTSGSIKEGIRIIQDYELVIDPDSFNLAKELNNYSWSDKKSGIPIDAYNHLLDPLRYWALTHLSSRPATKGIGIA